jgi:hypothetical protein
VGSKPTRFEAKFLYGADEYLFEVAKPKVQVLPEVPEIENRVSHELARAVVSDVATPPGFLDLDAACRIFFE